MKGKLVRIKSTHNNLRTDEVVGEYASLPEVGERFRMTAPPLEQPEGVRIVVTTPVRSVEHSGNVVRFTTENSTYELHGDST